jgi:hypothetical protein
VALGGMFSVVYTNFGLEGSGMGVFLARQRGSMR